jgi:hypothetical protein
MPMRFETYSFQDADSLNPKRTRSMTEPRQSVWRCAIYYCRLTTDNVACASVASLQRRHKPGQSGGEIVGHWFRRGISTR